MRRQEQEGARYKILCERGERRGAEARKGSLGKAGNPMIMVIDHPPKVTNLPLLFVCLHLPSQ